MAVVETVIWSGPLVANSLNYSDYFSEADYLYLQPSQGPDWSVSGDFVEIDCSLLVTVAPSVKRQIPVTQISTRDLIYIPRELADSGLLFELILQASFSVDIVVKACIVEASVVVPVV